MATGTAWPVLLAAADTSSEGPRRPSARVLHGLGALAKPGAKRQTQEVGTGWPDFDPDFAEEPILKALRHLSLIVPPFKNRFVPSALAFKALSFALKQVWCIVARA